MRHKILPLVLNAGDACRRCIVCHLLVIRVGKMVDYLACQVSLHSYLKRDRCKCHIVHDMLVTSAPSVPTLQASVRLSHPGSLAGAPRFNFAPTDY